MPSGATPDPIDVNVADGAAADGFSGSAEAAGKMAATQQPTAAVAMWHSVWNSWVASWAWPKPSWAKWRPTVLTVGVSSRLVGSSYPGAER